MERRKRDLFHGNILICSNMLTTMTYSSGSEENNPPEELDEAAQRRADEEQRRAELRQPYNVPSTLGPWIHTPLEIPKNTTCGTEAQDPTLRQDIPDQPTLNPLNPLASRNLARNSMFVLPDCLNCVERGWMCGGQRPNCRQCTNYSEICRWPDPDRDPPWPNFTLFTLTHSTEPEDYGIISFEDETPGLESGEDPEGWEDIDEADWETDSMIDVEEDMTRLGLDIALEERDEEAWISEKIERFRREDEYEE
jgi:hypothetical protein